MTNVRLEATLLATGKSLGAYFPSCSDTEHLEVTGFLIENHEISICLIGS